MARPRSPSRDITKERWLESGGKLTTKELAEEAGVPESRIRKWKSEDNWKEQLNKKKRGGQPGNKNATGHGAPPCNKNAETHGAYSTVHLDELTPEERMCIESLTLNTKDNMLRELQLLIAKESNLRKKINELEHEEENTLHKDKVVEMLVPNNKLELTMAMKTVVKASPFDRAMKLEAELNKTHGRIIKLLDSIKSYELDCRRVELEERKYRLAKQKLTGSYNIDPETGEIDDETNDEIDEI